MNRKRLRTGLAAVVGSAVLVGGVLLGTSIAAAQNSEPSQLSGGPSTSVPDQRSDVGDSRVRPGGGCQFFQDLADHLGIDRNQLHQQLEEGTSLRQLLEDAGIDPETLPRLHRHGHMGDFGGGSGSGILPFLGDRGSRLGDLNLDIDLSGLHDRLASGMTLGEALTDMGVDVDSLVAQAKEAARQRIDQLVTDGRITSDRADELKQMVDDFDLSQGFPFGIGRPDLGNWDDGSQFRGPGRGFRFFDHHRGNTNGSDDPSAAGALLGA